MTWRRFEMLEHAFSQYGEMEVVGKADNPEIVKYFDELGFDGSKMKDETAWCSAFMNWCAKQACLPYSGKLNARSWLDMGEATDAPVPGDAVVFWRESPQSWKGHVGIYIRHDDKYVYCLGGNQSNMVCITAYPISRVLGYRSLVC